MAGPRGWHDEWEEERRMWEEERRMEAVFMLQDTVWNGVNHEPTAWDRTFRGGMGQWTKTLEHYSDAFGECHTPQEDWLVITVDYHS